MGPGEYDPITEKDWIKKYIFWELELLKILGYDLALENLVEKDLEGNKTVYYASSFNEKKYVPNSAQKHGLNMPETCLTHV